MRVGLCMLGYVAPQLLVHSSRYWSAYGGTHHKQTASWEVQASMPGCMVFVHELNCLHNKVENILVTCHSTTVPFRHVTPRAGERNLQLSITFTSSTVNTSDGNSRDQEVLCKHCWNR